MTLQLSVIIPTHNREKMLPRTIHALRKQTLPADQFEVIMVADGCRDNTAVFLRSLDLPFRLTVLEQDGLGPSAARNSGAKIAKGQILVFFDDDIEVVPTFLAAHLAAHQQAEHAVVLGPLPLVSEQDDYFSRAIRAWWEGKFYDMRQPGYRFSYTDLYSGNFSVPAVLFQQANGFDLALRTHEDYELGLRLLRAGARFAFADEALGYHHDVTDLDRSLRRRQNEAIADIWLIETYPELRLSLPLATAPFSRTSKLLRALAFRSPKMGDWFSTRLRNRLPLLEKLWLRRAWQATLLHLQDYHYWRGVAGQKTSAQVQAWFTQENTDDTWIKPEKIYNLQDGIEQIAEQLTQSRPDSIRLLYGDDPVGEMIGWPGGEKLHGDHLRPFLATTPPYDLVHLMATEHIKPQKKLSLWLPQPEKELKPWPKRVDHIDLKEPIKPLRMEGYHHLHLLVTNNDRPLGWLKLNNFPGQDIPAEVLKEYLYQTFGWQVLPELLEKTVRFSQESPQPGISIIVCTRDRAQQLEGCLQALLTQEYGRYEIIVVDNAPASEATSELAHQLPVRYVREMRPGLDWARNRGIAEARYELIAFTDDDARPNSRWLQHLARAFAEPEVMAVTGPVLPECLETEAQNLFEFGYGGMSHGFKRRIFRRSQFSSVDLLWSSGFGVGANMAFRRGLFKQIGAFDPALDVGTATSGGGDVEMFHRVVANGHTLLYEPAAFVWHQHRPSEADFMRLLENNGRSFGAFLRTCWRNGTVPKMAILNFTLRHWLWGWLGKRMINPGQLTRRHVWQEIRGAADSLHAYHKAQLEATDRATQTTYHPLSPSILQE